MTDARALGDRGVIAVYGTLRRGQRNHSLLEGADYLGDGRIRGALHDVPRAPYRPYAYPALVDSEPGDVVVELYAIREADALGRLDELERYDPDDVEHSQYVRITVGVRDGPVDSAFAYAYRGPAAELGEPIESGDWVAFSDAREQASGS